jgi:predicted transcriptional regulator
MQEFKPEDNLIQFPVEKETTKINYNIKAKLLEIASNIILSSIDKEKNKIINIDYEIIQLYNKYLNLLSLESSSVINQSIETKSSYNDDYIICLEDGKKLKMLKRHLRTHYNMSIEEYKRKWNLSQDYPSVCKNYSIKRKNIATKKSLT